MRFSEAQTSWQTERSFLEERGVSWAEGAPIPVSYVADEYRHNYKIAMDAQPSLVTDPNSGVPALLTTMIDPQVFRVLFAPNRAAKIFGEVRKGTWIDETAMFPVVESTGEVSTYGDYSENGRAGVNTNWPQRQAYLFQTVKEYGEREMERAGLARINWVSEIDTSAATVLNKFSNYTYFFGVVGLQNYGLLNDPNLTAPLTPATKAAGGVKWINTSGQVVATANEVYNDIQSIFLQLVSQSGGLIDAQAKMKLCMSPTVSVALTATNSFNVNVSDLLEKNFPNMTVEVAVQYGALTASNPQGIAAGNLVQLMVEEVEGQDVGYCAFNEKMRSHPIVRQMSSFRQKVSAGTWGSIIRQPFGIAAMVGV